MNEKSMRKLFERLLTDYLCYFDDPVIKASINPVKVVNILKRENGIATETLTYLPARTKNGFCGIKEIYVNDETGEYGEMISVRGEGKKHVLIDQGITPVRCGAMTAVALHISNQLYNLPMKKIGFIGNGRTNLMNARFIKAIFGSESYVIRGSYKDRGKNHKAFNEIAPTAVDDTCDMRLLNECDAIIVTTSNYEKDHMISAAELSKPKILVVLDCGYTLDESFRKSCNSYTEYPEQINHEYSEEFPFDNERYDMHNLAEPLIGSKEGRTCVYLHGIGFADITTAEMLIKGEIEL